MVQANCNRFIFLCSTIKTFSQNWLNFRENFQGIYLIVSVIHLLYSRIKKRKKYLDSSINKCSSKTYIFYGYRIQNYQKKMALFGFVILHANIRLRSNMYIFLIKCGVNLSVSWKRDGVQEGDLGEPNLKTDKLG